MLFQNLLLGPYTQVEEQVTDTQQALQDFLKERQPMQSLNIGIEIPLVEL